MKLFVGIIQPGFKTSEISSKFFPTQNTHKHVLARHMDDRRVAKEPSTAVTDNREVIDDMS